MLSNTSSLKKERKGKKEKAPRSLFKSESAAVTAIAAVLLLSLAFTLISVVKLSYVPEWKIDAERDHNYDAWDSMEGVKTRAEIFTHSMDSDINYSAYGLSTTVPFSMGGGEVPVFEPSKSSGELSVNTERCTMIVKPGYHAPYIVDCGGITYFSENRQYTDQTFRYENGALILAQGENSQMKRVPSLNIQEVMGGNYTVTINAIELIGEPASISANTFTALRLTGCSIDPIHDSDDYGDVDSFNLTILTHYTDAWATYFNETARDAGLVYGTDYTIESIPASDYVRFSFLSTGSKTLERLYVSKTVIGAELGAGSGFNYANLGGGGGVIIPEGSTPGESVMELDTWYHFDTFTGDYSGGPLSSTPNPDDLKDYDSDTIFPPGTYQDGELALYSPNNEFSYYVAKENNLNLNFSFVTFSEFNSSEPIPSNATIRMIYQYDQGANLWPDINMGLTSSGHDFFNPKEDWRLYNKTLSISADSPSNLTFNLKINADNREQGTFYIDYLAIRLN